MTDSISPPISIYFFITPFNNIPRFLYYGIYFSSFYSVFSAAYKINLDQSQPPLALGSLQAMHLTESLVREAYI